MVFYVYFDPALISVAMQGGSLGLACLVGIIRDLEQNCFLAEFDDWHVQEEIRDNVRLLEDKLLMLDNEDGAALSAAIKCLKSLFATLAKRNRFIYCLASSGETPNTRVAAVLVQARKAELDLILADKTGANPNPDGFPTATLQSYTTTNFESQRSLAAKGMLLAPGALGEREFLNIALRKVLKHSSTIHIYDSVMGNRWGDNFEYTLKTLLFWLAEFIANPTEANLHLHCSKPAGFGDEHMKDQLRSFRRGSLARLPITIHFHDTFTGDDTLPHDRFLITDQIAIEIGRGMDFLDRHTHRNRDASLSLKDLTQLGDFLKEAATTSLPPVCC